MSVNEETQLVHPNVCTVIYSDRPSELRVARHSFMKIPSRCVAGHCGNYPNVELGIVLHAFPFYGDERPIAVKASNLLFPVPFGIQWVIQAFVTTE